MRTVEEAEEVGIVGLVAAEADELVWLDKEEVSAGELFFGDVNDDVVGWVLSTQSEFHFCVLRIKVEVSLSRNILARVYDL